MYDTLSNKQKEKFLATSGKRYDAEWGVEIALKTLIVGSFLAEHPYNDKNWNMSPWRFTFVLEKETGNFVCELRHRMTNNRIYGWDQEGDELSHDDLNRYFEDDIVLEV